MQATTAKKDTEHFLYPGMLFAQSEPCNIITILGSCVSICLWDHSTRIGGMNHYLLPFWNGEGLRTPKYGNVAIPMLIEKLLSLGCRKSNLRAKVIGGANILNNSSGLLNVGERNIIYAEDCLSEEKIPIINRDTGGLLGRKVKFLPSTGEVLVKKVQKQNP